MEAPWAPPGSARGGAVAALALLLGVLLVALFDAALAHSRYPYSGDSASYIEMATSLHADGRPRVTPWEIEPGDSDAVPQPLFPPGFALLVAALIPVAGDARAAAGWPSRIAAALLPLLLVVCWRGAARPQLLLLIGAWLLLSPGVREWQFVAYSDVTALALAVAALGLLAGALADAGAAAGGSARRWLAAGVLAALCYAVRNAGLAVLAASVAALVYARARAFIGWRPLALWLGGAAVPLAALEAYNLATFGTLWPYTMPPAERGWLANAGDLAAAQLGDLGLPAELADALSPLARSELLALLFAGLALAFWATRRERAAHLRLAVLAGYAACGAALLIASRSRYEWGNLIDERNVLQYSFALALALAVALGALLPARGRWLGVAALCALVAVRGVECVREALAARVAAPESWLELTRDATLMARARAIPKATLVASNAAVLFRIGAPRAVRQLDVGGDDRDFEGALARLAAAAAPRPAAFLLVCNEWTWQFSACHGRAASAAPAAPACTALRSAPPLAAECALVDGGEASSPAPRAAGPEANAAPDPS
jgi:hypothetical protein